MPASIAHRTGMIQSEPRYAVTGAFYLGWSGNDNRRHSALGHRAGTQPASLPVQLANRIHRIPSHAAGVLSP